MRGHGEPELAADARYATHRARGDHAEELDRRIDDWTRTWTADDLPAHGAEAGVPSGRVYTAADALTVPHYLARGMVETLTSTGGTTMPVPGVVPRFSRTPGTLRSAGPALGEANEDLVGRPAPPPGS